MLEWMQQARCAETDPEVFFPDSYRPTEGAAKEICEGCEVRAECLTFAISNHLDDGIYGGTNRRERKLEARKRGRRKKARVAKCGTVGGAQAHYRRGEQPCTPCREADAERQRQNRLAAKMRAS